MVKSIFLNLAVSVATVAIAGLSALPASAAGLTWTLNNTIFDDGSTATGSFDYDGSVFTNVNIKVEQGIKKYPTVEEWGGEYIAGTWQFPAAVYKDEGIPQGGFYGSPFAGSHLWLYETDSGWCCRGVDLGFSTPLSKFSTVADYISGGIASVAVSVREQIDYKWLGAAGVYFPERNSRPGAYISTTFPTRYEPVPEPSMILGSVVPGAAIIGLRRKRTRSNQTEP